MEKTISSEMVFFFFKTSRNFLYLREKILVMKLELKREFLEWSIGCGGKSIKRKLKNIHPSEFEKLYNEGYKDFFIVSKENLPHSERDVLKPIKNTKKEDDFTKPAGE